jgi:UDP-N-acetylmuramoyl-tripeptide--D-alanyl-D-alanine ligase
MKFTVGEIAEATGGEILAGLRPGEGGLRPGEAGSAGAPAGRIVTDTRALAAGETFLALRGRRFDGHAFLEKAVRRGASCLVIDRPESLDALGRTDARLAVVQTPDTLEALGALARAARRRLKCPVIAITGSCGKTTLKEMVGQVLGRRLKGRLPPKSFNNLIGVPLTLLGAEEDDAFVLCEFGTNAPGEIGRLSAMAEPTIGAVTLVGPAHLEGLGSLEGVAAEKGALVESLPPKGLAVLNADDPRVAAMAGRCRARVVTFGRSEGADLRAEDLIQTDRSIQFTAVRAGAKAGAGVGFVLPVPGEHQALLALASALVAREVGVPLEAAAEALRDFRPPPMRLAVEEAGGILVVNDVYNANPESMRAALRLLAFWPERRKVFFCGDMLELGAHSAAAHAALGREIAEAGVRRLVCVGTETRATARAAVEAGLAGDAVSTYASADLASADAAKTVERGDVVLVKGSRAIGMERVVEAIAAAAAPAGEPTR